MLATIIISTTLVAAMSSYSESIEVYHFFADGPHEALMLAQEIHEGAMLLCWVESDESEATFGPDVDTLWDLDGMSFKPPRSAEFEQVVSHMGWTQEVEVRHVALDDPTQVVDPETYEGDTLVELVVSISQGANDYGEFSWWMTEPEHENDA